jgi:hypothetical protein
MNNLLTVDNFSLIYPEQLLLEFSVADRQKAWKQTKKQNYTHKAASWNAYLNILSLNIFETYLNKEADVKTKPKIWTQLEDLPSFWQVVNGTCLEIDNKRLILFSYENKEFSELRVQREWLDIPSWIGDYYLAVELYLEECWMRVYGYATYQQLRDSSIYDPVDETYSLAPEELIQNLTVMWTMWQSELIQKVESKPLLMLSDSEAESLLEKLSFPSTCSPRLNVPFEKWRALIGNNIWRKKLYEMQQQKAKQATEINYTNVGHWLQNIFESGWQSWDTFINARLANLAYSFRQKTPNLAGEVVEGVKVIDLADRSLLLSIGLKPENEENISIFVRIYALGETNYLPENLQLALLSKAGQKLQQVRSREKDNLIQLKRFVCSKRKRFNIQISLDNLSVTENLTIDL